LAEAYIIMKIFCQSCNNNWFQTLTGLINMIYLLINKKGGDGSGSTGLQMYVTSYMCSSAQ